MEPIEASDELKTEKIVIPQSAKERIMLAEQQAIIIAIGSEAWKEESQPRAAVGDTVMISKYAGTLVRGKDGKQYRAVNANDIFLQVVPVEEMSPLA